MPSKLNCYLVIPVSASYRNNNLSSCARKLLTGAIRQAEGFVRRPVLAIGVMRPWGECYQLQTKRQLNIGTFFKRGTHLFMNVGFLVSDAPPIDTLIQNARKGEWSWSGQAGTNAFHAMAFNVQGLWKKTGIVTSREKVRWGLLRLTASLEEVNSKDTIGEQLSLKTSRLLTPDAAGIDHSPSMENIHRFKHRLSAFDPRFLNIAFMEILSHPVPAVAGLEGADAMIFSLLKHRGESAVPWIFNAMVNEIEFRIGSTFPEAFPPEIHLSATGVCNINCRFCNYENGIARPNSASSSQIQEMDYLQNIQTLRLSSGLGEPTLNPHLPEIIDIASSNFPHLQLGFFSNGFALDQNGLVNKLVGNVNWINVSLNAASSESYRVQCHINGFNKVTENLSRLWSAKTERKNLMPLVMGSMVLNRKNLSDLSKMPALCRRLGIDRLAVFPFSALGSHDPSKLGPDDTLAACMLVYGPLYDKTVKAAEKYRVSLEIPTPSSHSRGHFGISETKFYDFARIESNQWPMGRFLTDLKFENPEGSFCNFLWRYALIGSTNNTGHAANETHFLYPCVGPLSSVDLSRRTAFRFQREKGFMNLWQHPVLNFLRKAQHHPGTCNVCDLCRNNNVRDPKHFQLLEEAVGRFAASQRTGEDPRQ
jgi:sulfatase maturation enzyme AslB (radical SAM superfamily)